MQPAPDISPQLVWDTMVAFQRSAALKAAVDLDLFTTIAKGNRTAAEIAGAVGAEERGVRILCDSLSVIGFLTKSDSNYGLTPSTSTFLDKSSPAYLGSAVYFLMSDAQRRGFDDLTNAVRHGGSEVKGDASMDPESPMWAAFARNMAPLMFPAAESIAQHIGGETDRKLKVLDIAAGHGIFGIMVARRFANAEVYGTDWANVLEVAVENAEKFGVADRYHTIPGDAFTTDFGTGYDVILVPNFLHHFDKQTCEQFLAKLRPSLTDDGKVMTVEFVPNDDRVSPPPQAMFALIMLAATPAGDAYTFAELKEMFENAGFTRNEIFELQPIPQHLVVSMK